MMQAAVPEYLQHACRDAAPGHRFSLYFSIWDPITWEMFKYSSREKKSEKIEALIKVCSFGPDDERRLSALVDRQQAQAVRLGKVLFVMSAVSTAPFMTGMGYEHPLENGFAFLNPYGLPYLPGSSLKGVLRSAAEELVLSGDMQDFDMLDVWRLFGFDGQAAFLLNKDDELQRAFTSLERLRSWLLWLLPDEYLQLSDPEAFLAALPENRGLRQAIFNEGALCFWDAFPQGKLTIEIMTPHHSKYLQEANNTPHDSEQPIPIPFLAIAPKAHFSFFVQCIGDTGPCDWRSIIQQCFGHAFDWLGFGAKTSVGYGALEEDPAEVERRKKEEKAKRRADEERKQQEEEVRRRSEEENKLLEAVEARKQQLEAMPEHQRMMLEAGEELDRLRLHMHPTDNSGYGDLRHLSKTLLAAADRWPEDARREFADWWEQTLDKLDRGWRHPELNPKQRKRWEKRTREALQVLRK